VNYDDQIDTAYWHPKQRASEDAIEAAVAAVAMIADDVFMVTRFDDGDERRFRVYHYEHDPHETLDMRPPSTRELDICRGIVHPKQIFATRFVNNREPFQLEMNERIIAYFPSYPKRRSRWTPVEKTADPKRTIYRVERVITYKPDESGAVLAPLVRMTSEESPDATIFDVALDSFFRDLVPVVFEVVHDRIPLESAPAPVDDLIADKMTEPMDQKNDDDK
jgi:hypothetical protein